MRRNSMPIITETIEELNKKSLQNNLENINKDFLNDKIFIKDILYFKNEILKEVKQLDYKLSIQNNINNDMNKKLSLYNSKLEDFTKKIDNFSNFINKKDGETNYYTKKLDTLYEFKTKIEQDSISQNYKLNLTAEELKDAINKYDKLIYNNIIYPGVIGMDCKFKDYHEFIDYVLQQINTFSVFKEKNIFDLKIYKKKLESNIKSLNLQFQSLLNNANSYAINNIKESEEKCLNQIKLYDEKLFELKVENCDFVKKMEIQNKEILKEWKKITEIKKEVTDLIETTVENIKNSNNDIQKLFDDYQEEFKEIKNNYILLTNLFHDNKEQSSNINITLANFNQKDYINKKFNQNNENNDINENNEMIKINDVNPKTEKNNSNDLIIKKIGKKEHISIKNKIKSKKARRIKSAESILKNYIKGKSTLEELIERNKRHHNESDINNNYQGSISFKKTYDENIHQLSKNESKYKTIDYKVKNQDNNSFSEKNYINKTINISPKTVNNNNYNKNNLSETRLKKKTIEEDYHTEYHWNLINLNNIISNKVKIPEEKKILLIKDGNNIVHNNRNKSNDNESKNNTRNIEKDVFFGHKNANIRQLSDLSFLIEDKKYKFPKIEDAKNKDVDTNGQKDNKNKRKINNKNNKYEEKNIVSSYITKDSKNKTISSDIVIKQNYSNKNFRNDYINNNNLKIHNYSMNNECLLKESQIINNINKKGNRNDFYVKSKSIKINAEKNK